jgi:hypothetical protein
MKKYMFILSLLLAFASGAAGDIAYNLGQYPQVAMFVAITVIVAVQAWFLLTK